MSISEPRVRRFCLLLLGLIVALSAPGPIHACDAPPACSYDPGKRFEEADVVFRGRVLAYEDHEHPEFMQLLIEHLNLGITADFEVIEAWKGVETRTVRLHAERSTCGAGMWKLEPGTEMLVLAINHEGKLLTNECIRPIPVNSEAAQTMLANLGPGARNLPTNFRHMIVRVGPWLLVMFVLSAGWWWRRRRAQVQVDA
jgi:hypothetical protein